MQRLAPEYLAALRFDGTRAATPHIFGECQGKPQLYSAQSRAALKGVRHIVVVEFADSYSRPGGGAVVPSQLRSLVIRDAMPKSRSEEEMACARYALAPSRASPEHPPFSDGVTMNLHACLYCYIPRADKGCKAANGDIIVRRHCATSHLRFQPVAESHEPMAIGNLIRLELGHGSTSATGDEDRRVDRIYRRGARSEMDQASVERAQWN